MAKDVLALEGAQLVTVMLSVTGTAPVFLTQTVLVVESVGARFPQSKLVQLLVHALFV